MKQILKQILITACATFTIFMTLSLVSAYIFVGPNEGLSITLGLLLVSIIAASFQGLWFTEGLIKNMRYPYRLLGFAASFAPVLFVIAWFLGWFPLNPGSIIMFFLIFFMIFGAMALGYTLYYKKTAGSYEEALKQYRKKNEPSN